jgi:NADPH-dependent ferric siderophore reductase
VQWAEIPAKHVVNKSEMSSAEDEKPGRVLAQMPTGECIPLVPGSQVLIGRDSNVPEIKAALERFDAVSRKHCYVKISEDGKSITVNDPGSTNHTWLDSDTEYLRTDEHRNADLPVNIHLGRNLAIAFKLGGVE